MAFDFDYPAFFQDLRTRLQAHPDTLAVVYFSELLRFQCGRCTLSCIRPWEVALAEDEYHKLKSLLPDTTFQGAIKKNTLEPHPFASIRKQEQSHRCFFLDSDQLCHLHREYGPEAKPRTCLHYPRQGYALYPQYMVMTLQSSCSVVPEEMRTPPALEVLYQPESVLLKKSNQPEGLLDKQWQYLSTLESLFSQASRLPLEDVLSLFCLEQPRRLTHSEQQKVWRWLKKAWPQTALTPRLWGHLEIQGLGLGVAFTPEEQGFVVPSLRHWLLRSLLAAHPIRYQQQHFEQVWLILGVRLAYVVLLCVAYRMEKTTQTLEEIVRHAFNTEGRLSHNLGWLKDLGITDLSCADAQIQLRHMADFVRFILSS